MVSSCLQKFLAAVGLGLLASTEYVVAERIAFGSCNNPHRVSIWDAISRTSPNRIMLLGDTIYADREPGQNPWIKIKSADTIETLYGLVKSDPGFKSATANATLIATFDDHDYGENNGDKTFRFRKESQVEGIV